MKLRWLVTPYFFDSYDGALTGAVPAGTPHRLNDPGRHADRSCQNLAPAHSAIAAFSESAAKAGEIPVSIAGDCAASLPVMAGLQAAGLSPTLVWLDAHGDFNNPQTSPSGFLGGMPLAMMVGRGDLELARSSGARPLPEKDVWLIGAREFDPLERKALDSSEINRGQITELRAGLNPGRPGHLHIDNDVIDAADVPANNYPVPGGPRLETVIEACVTFAGQNDIRALSFSGWNGALDRDGKTRAACAELLSALGDALNRRL